VSRPAGTTCGRRRGSRGCRLRSPAERRRDVRRDVALLSASVVVGAPSTTPPRPREPVSARPLYIFVARASAGPCPRLSDLSVCPSRLPPVLPVGAWVHDGVVWCSSGVVHVRTASVRGVCGGLFDDWDAVWV